MTDYEALSEEMAGMVFSTMAERVPEEQIKTLKQAYALAKEAHAPQRRKSGEPYILHPISVALIAARELKLDTSSVCAAFLHDVVEDTPHTIDDIRRMFGDDVAFLVDAVTKKAKNKYKTSKQVDNYEQLLDSIHYDIRALMVKLADRLHNMRTLASMRPDKQMKIAGETDYFYAPLANRLGLFDVKTELENLSFRYRCFMQYGDIEKALEQDVEENRDRLMLFASEVEEILKKNGIKGKARVYYRRPYSIWRKMQASGKDFKHVDNRYYVRVTFTECDDHSLNEKNVCLRIYSLLTDVFKEKPQSYQNMIDQAKENSYQCLRLMLLSREGIWEDVQICSERMVENSKLGCMAGIGIDNVRAWIEKFKIILKEIASEAKNEDYLKRVVTTLYYDDVIVFTPKGKAVRLPKGSSAIDFAFEIGKELGLKAKYARINGKLESIKTVLHQGDCVEIGQDEESRPKNDWMEHVSSYKAKRHLGAYFRSLTAGQKWTRCPYCKPLPGGETIGYRETDGTLTVHRRNCPEVIEQASKHGDSIVAVDDFVEQPDVQFPVTIRLKAIDRYHLLIDIVHKITNDLGLSIDSLTTVTQDDIVDCKAIFFVHSVRELVTAMKELYTIPGIDEVHQME